MKHFILKSIKVFATSAVVMLLSISAFGQKKNIAPDAATNCQGSGGVTPYCYGIGTESMIKTLEHVEPRLHLFGQLLLPMEPNGWNGYGLLVR